MLPKMIAHRGLIDGCGRENHPDTIRAALDAGYECEIDYYAVHYGEWLGHDRPQYRVNDRFLKMKGLWIHCKNMCALMHCEDIGVKNYFWHEDDEYTMTSSGYVISHPRAGVLLSGSVAMLPEKSKWSPMEIEKSFAICSDYIGRYL